MTTAPRIAHLTQILESVAETYSVEQIQQMLWSMIQDQRHPEMPAPYATQAALAKAIGVSSPHLSGVLRGVKPPTGKVLAFLGIERVVTFRRRVS